MHGERPRLRRRVCEQLRHVRSPARARPSFASVSRWHNNRVKKGDVLVELIRSGFAAGGDQTSSRRCRASEPRGGAGYGAQSDRLGARFAFQASARDRRCGQSSCADSSACRHLGAGEGDEALAQAEFERSKKLLATKVASVEEFDTRRKELDVANAQVKQALENVYQARAALGLPAQPAESTSLLTFRPILINVFIGARGPGRP